MARIKGWDKVGYCRWVNRSTGKFMRVVRISGGGYNLPYYLVAYGRRHLKTFPRRIVFYKDPEKNDKAIKSLPEEKKKAVKYAVDWMKKHPNG